MGAHSPVPGRLISLTPESLMNSFAGEPQARDEGGIAMRSPIDLERFTEFQLLDFRMNCRRQIAGILFEGRMALDLDEGDTGVLVAREVVEFQWESEVRVSSSTAWNSITAEISDSGDLLALEMEFMPVAKLRILARALGFFEVKADRLSGIGIPDYAASENEIKSALVDWETPVAVVRKYELLSRSLACVLISGPFRCETTPAAMIRARWSAWSP